MHILLIDDSSSTRSLLRTLINSGQAVRHEISEAASGEESLQKVASGEINLPDLIIMDINMGGMSGYELCRQFRQQYGTVSDVVPYIIIVTANEGVDVINEALDSGANDYMAKPVNVKVLHVRLRVAERLLSQANTSNGNTTAAAGSPPAPAQPALADAGNASEAPAVNNTREAMIGLAIDQADAPIAIIDIDQEPEAFRISYANIAMTESSQYEYTELMGKSLAEMEAWTPEFLSMILGYINRGAIISHVPLWSKTRQQVPVHLSFYPINADDGTIKQYLVIHHF
jgi:CheY-like chemotaxis protein